MYDCYGLLLVSVLEESVKVGDLVELSAKGRKLRWTSLYADHIGYIIEVKYPNYIVVKWMGLTKGLSEVFTRGQLRYATVRKR